MASVRMTNELRNDIFRAADNAFDTANPDPKPSTEFMEVTRLALQSSLPNRILKEMLDKAVDAGIQERPSQENNLPKTREIQKFTLKKKLDTDDSRDWDYVEMTLTTPMEYTTIEYRNENLSWSSPDFWLHDLDTQFQTEITELFEDFSRRRSEHQDARRNYRSGIRDLLEKTTTLKQLLEVWPAAESLVPSDKLQKLHEKVTRKQRAQTIKEEINFDPTLANQTVLTSKMLGI